MNFFLNIVISSFFSQAKQEILKVVWPDKNKVLVSLALILFVVLIFSILLLGIDYLFFHLVKLILSFNLL